MTDREKLIALVYEGKMKRIDICADIEDCGLCEHDVDGEYCCDGVVADHLLANGVTFATDNNVGGKWIPVTERLPGTEKVLITDGDIVMRGYRRSDGVWKYGVDLHEVWENMSLRPVTHWMPLPEPPKEGERC